MRVLFLAAWYPCRDLPNDGLFVREHAKAVLAAGDEVVVVHLSPMPPEGKQSWQLEKETDPALMDGVTTYHLYRRLVVVHPAANRVSRKISYWLTFGREIWSAVRTYRRLRAGGFHPDVIHAHVYTAGVPAVVVGKLFRRPVLVTEHYTGFPQHTLPLGGLQKARFAFGRAAVVLPVCEFLQRAIESYRIKARYRIVPNAVDTTVFHPAAAPAPLPGPKRLLFVGALEPTHHKGFPMLVEALDRLRDIRTDWHLDVVGDGPSRAEYEALIDAASLGDLVTFQGRKPKPVVAEMMRTAHAFVLSSAFENLPCVLIESMATGLPIVSTNVGGIPEMVSDRDGILVPPGDPAAMCAAIDQMLSGLASYDRDDIVRRAGERFGLPAVGAQLHDVYRSVSRA
jgi:glycosyltransferase involved in cell wall biosynthesis